MSEGDPLFAELVATPAFQRLKSIRFLGGIDYLLVRAPNGAKGNIRYTRYQHSLGVARLALLYCEERGLSFSERRMIWVAALLHDVGHAPLSHSLEPVFQEASRGTIAARNTARDDAFSKAASRSVRANLASTMSLNGNRSRFAITKSSAWIRCRG
jgi:HD superfamily phosphohydrolase